MLKSCELFKLWRPDRVYIALLPSGRANRAGDKILVSVHEFVVLQAQEDEKVCVLLDQVHASFVLNWGVEVLVACK